MKRFLSLSMFFFLMHTSAFADVSITGLPAVAPAGVGSSDVFPFVNISLNQTSKLKISEILSVPSLQSPSFTGTVTAAKGVVTSTLTRGNAYYTIQYGTTNQSVTNTSLTIFPSYSALSFTPPVTAKYRIQANAAIYPNVTAVGGNVIVAIRASTGSPTYLAYGDVYFNPGTTSYASAVTPWVDVTLTGNVAYAFDMYGKSSAGTITSVGNVTANGIYMTATQVN